MQNLRDMKPGAGFRVGLMDPPWRFQGRNNTRFVPARGQDPYPTMTVAELAAMPVDDVMAPDAALFMWIIDTHLDQALYLGGRWGFRYKTIAFIWDKGRMGFGHWSRKEAEVCLLFTRGKMARADGAGGVRQIIRAKPREHSRKPDEQYPRIEKLMGGLEGGPYLEMFARPTRPGWAAWGNQVGSIS